MSSLSVAALVISHKQPDYLRETLQGLLEQTLRPSQIMVVETSADQSSLHIARELGVAHITPGDLRLGAAIEAGRAALAEQVGWLWILHEDSRPEPRALEKLARAAEISPSVAIIGPKLLRWEDPIRIQQMGLTVTRSGRPFLLVQDEYDQGQHDSNGDVLAVSTAGMLISDALWSELGGIDDETPVFAQDLELGLRARAKGYRVVLEAAARVHHAGLSMQGMRPRSWIGGSRLEGLSRAHVHLATTLWPLPLVILLYLLMPLIVLANIPVNLLAKRPKRVFSQLTGWLWAWGTLPKRLRSRAKLQAGSLKGAKALYATSAQIRRRRLSELVEEPEPQNPTLDGIFASNQAWFALLPLFASFSLWPQGAALTERLVPLSENFAALWQNVSSNLIPVGAGLVAPSDPFNWFLALIAFISPLGPSFAVALFLFVGSALAFFTAWKFVSLFSSSPWARTMAALGYSLSPLVLGVALSGQLVEIVAAVFAPLAGFLIVKALTAFNSARSWRWTGLAGLTLTVVAVSSPLLAALIAVVTLVAAGFFLRRALIVIWALLPSVLTLWPWVEFWFSKGLPELATASSWATAGPIELGLGPQGYFLVGALALSVFGIWWLSPAKGLVLGAVAASAFVISWYQPVASTEPILGFGALLLLAIFAGGLAASKLALKVAASVMVLVAVLGQAVLLSLLGPSQVSYGQTRQMPALVVAQANVDPGVVRTLHIEVGAELTEAEVIWDDGLGLEERGFATRFVPAPDAGQGVADLVASLVAGNPAEVEGLLAANSIGFILLQANDANLLSQLEVGISAMEFLQPAGQSEFGLLWQTGVAASQAPKAAEHFLDKQLMLWVFAAFALLALPTPAAIRGSRPARRGER